MKKLITLLTIVAVAIGCALTSPDCEANTKKKRAATRKTTAVSRAKTPTSAGLTIDDFCYLHKEPGYGNAFVPRETEDIVSRLRGKGFDVEVSTEVRDDDAGLHSDTGSYVARIYTLTKTTDKGTTTVVCDDNIDIEFPAQTDVAVFTRGLKTAGYRYYKYDTFGRWIFPSKCDWLGGNVNVEGNSVKIWGPERN